MIELSNFSLLKIFTKLLVLLVAAKAISLLVWWYLPSDGVELSKKENYQPKYQRADFKNMIHNANTQKTMTGENVGSRGVSITNMILKGLYGASSKGFVIVALKSSPKKTSIVGINEIFSGFTLKSITISSAIFTKGGKEYILELQKIKNQKSTISKVGSAPESSEVHDVKRNDITYYSKNPKEMWKDISIKEVKNGKNIDGFKVTRIKKNSKMAKVGLQKGDVIIKANNVDLKSYKDVLDIYGEINDLSTIQIVILRNNQEKELVYEIN